MSVQTETSPDVALAVAVVMRENACDAHTSSFLIRERARALDVTLADVAATIVAIEDARHP